MLAMPPVYVGDHPLVLGERSALDRTLKLLAGHFVHPGGMIARANSDKAGQVDKQNTPDWVTGGV
jgi:hypothetical protein